MNAKRLGGERAAVIACLLTGASTFLIRNAALGYRAYSLLFLLVNVFIWLYLKRLDSSGKESISSIIKLGLVMTLLMYTHYFGCLVAAMFFFADIILFFRKKIKWQCVFSYLITAVLFFPWFFGALKSILDRNGNFWAGSPSLSDLYYLLLSLCCDSRILIAVFFGTILIQYWRIPVLQKAAYNKDFDKRFVIKVFAAVCLFLIGAAYIYSRYIHPDGSFFVGRYFISILPMVVLVITIGIVSVIDSFSIKGIFLIPISIIAAISIGMNHLNDIRVTPQAINEPYEQAIDWIYQQDESHAADSAILTIYIENKGIWYYVTHKGQRPEINYINARNVSPEELNQFNRIYQFDRATEPLPEYVTETLTENYDLIEAHSNPNVLIYQKKSQ
jgi:hypothetical protein